jgi:hypothetical protein
MPLGGAVRLWALALAVLAGGCWATPLPGDDGKDMATVIDFAGDDLASDPTLFTGIFSWDPNVSSAINKCDNGGMSTDHPSGPFPITLGPGPKQINIGAGSTACPIFIFDVQGLTAPLANVGVTCPSGGGFLTTHGGQLALDPPNVLHPTLMLDAMEPNGGGGFVHCLITVSGTANRL